MGKTLFAHIRDGHGQLQLYIRKDELGEETYNQALKLFDLGDWVQATGECSGPRPARSRCEPQICRCFLKP
ncbi:MAG: OB-fold nucleic acid binding domain-containing protein [Thermomicrobiales bacterium]